MVASGDATSDKQLNNLNREIEFRNRAKRNMWITIGVICFVVTYVSLYSLVLYLGPEDQCNISDSEWVRSFSTAIERQIQYIAWLYPMLWLFWPAEAMCQCKKKARTSTMTTNGNNYTTAESHLSPLSINSKGNDSDENDSDDG